MRRTQQNQAAFLVWRGLLPCTLALLQLLLCFLFGAPVCADVEPVVMGPWCTVHEPVMWKATGGPKDRGHIHSELMLAAQRSNLSLIPFPSPASPKAWPNATTLATCKYVAFAPAVIDGLGSQYSRILFAMAWAYLNKASVIHLKPEFMDHHTDIDAVDSYLNLGWGELRARDVPPGSTVCLVEHCGPHTGATMTAYRPVLVEKMTHGSWQRLPPLPTFDFRKILISVHIRRGDVQFRQMDIATNRWTPDSYYVDVLRNLTRDLRAIVPHLGYQIHMYSQGNVSDFQNISMPLANEPLVWHLNEDEVTTLRGFICADIFVKGSSGLSGVGQWFSDAIMVYSLGGGWRPEVNFHAKNLEITTLKLTSRLQGRRFIHSGC